VPEFEKRWNRYAVSANSTCCVDETCYVNAHGEWAIYTEPSIVMGKRWISGCVAGGM